MNGERLKRLISLHAWVGIVGGLALFVAFYAGALNVFHDELHEWQHGHDAAAEPALTLDQAAQAAVKSPGNAQERLFVVPGDDPVLFWFLPDEAKGGDWQVASLSAFGADGSWQATPHSELADFINALHYQLAIPRGNLPLNPGLVLMGIIAVLYGVALISGLLMHWRKLRKELFSLTHQGNVRRYWTNMHNVIGVLSFPFHVIMSMTGAAMGLFTVLAVLFGALVFGPQLQPVIEQKTEMMATWESAETPVLMPAIDDMIDAAQTAVPDLEVEWIEIRGFGDANAQIDVAGTVPGYAGPYAHVIMSPDLDVTRHVSPTHRDLNAATFSLVYGLHFGNYGGPWVQWLYFGLAMLGTLLFVSGNILWCERRCDREGPSRSSAMMLRITLGVVFGVVAGLAGSFMVSKLAPGTAFEASIATWEKAICGIVVLLMVAWSLKAAPLRFASRQLWLLPVLYGVLPLLSFVQDGASAWHGDARVVNIMLWVVTALLVLIGYWFRQRLRRAEPHPLWVGRVQQAS